MNFNTAATAIRNHKIYFTVSLCTISGAILYNYLKKRGHINHSDPDTINNNSNNNSNKTNNNNQLISPNKPHEEKLIVENELIPKLLEPIKNIEQYTDTKITFSTNPYNPEQDQVNNPLKLKNQSKEQLDDDNTRLVAKDQQLSMTDDVDNKDLETSSSNGVDRSTHQVCSITGLYADVKEARYMLLKEIDRLSIVREEICFSKDIYRKVYNDECEVVQELNRITSAKVETNFSVEADTRKMRIVVSGSKDQVNVARKLIESTIKSWEIKGLRDTNKDHALKEINSHITLNPTNQLEPNSRFFEVNVSAIASPSKFWIQLINNNWNKLDEFVLMMGAFYESAINRRHLLLKNPQIGQLVAAFFPRDKKWYRAEIIGIIPLSRDSNDYHYDLYFVDFGNSEFILPNYVFQLHDRFKTMSYQAAECFLVNVNSLNPLKPDSWDDDATCFFEKLTDNIGGKRIICQVVTYKQVVCKVGCITKNIAVAGIELFYTMEDIVVNIGQMMISSGYACPTNKQFSTAHDTEILQSIENQVPTDKNTKNSKNNGFMKNPAAGMVDSNKFYEQGDNINIPSSLSNDTSLKPSNSLKSLNSPSANGSAGDSNPKPCKKFAKHP